MAGGGDLEALHAARECERRVGLDHELEPALAHDERDDPEVAARERAPERTPDRGEELAATRGARRRAA